MKTPLSLLKDFPRHADRWIGWEVERFVENADGRIQAYEPQIKSALCQLVKAPLTVAGKQVGGGWQIESGSSEEPLAVKRGFDVVSLEPGGQFEVAPAPEKDLKALAAHQAALDDELLKLPALKGAKFLTKALNQTQTWDQVPLLPSPRYALMSDYFGRVPNGRGREMMRLTCGIHLNFDYQNEAEMRALVRVALGLAPVFISWFANSKSAHAVSERQLIWEATDPKRCEFPDFMFDQEFSIEDYCRWVEEVPLMYAVSAKGTVFDPQGKNYRALSPSEREGMALPTLRQVFSPIRLKPCCVEVRYFDALNTEDRLAVTALLTGLLYEDGVRTDVIRLLSKMSAETVRSQMKEAVRISWSDERLALAEKILKLAERGLVARGLGEEDFLAPAERYVAEKSCPAMSLIEKSRPTS